MTVGLVESCEWVFGFGRLARGKMRSWEEREGEGEDMVVVGKESGKGEERVTEGERAKAWGRSLPRG